MNFRRSVMAWTFPNLPATAGAVVALAAAQPLAAQQDVAGTAPQTQYSHPAGFQDMVADKLPAVVGILSTARQGPETTMEMPDMPPRPPGFEDFFGGPGGPDAPRGPMQAQGSGFFITADRSEEHTSELQSL